MLYEVITAARSARRAGLDLGPRGQAGRGRMKLDKLKIRSLRGRALAVPMKRPLATATGAVTIAPLLLVDLETDGGVTGRSYLFGISPSHLQPMAALIEAMAPMIKGVITSYSIHYTKLYDTGRGRPTATYSRIRFMWRPPICGVAWAAPCSQR